MNTGFLLINLGTPRSPSTKDVRSYLNEFLMDPYVIDAPWPIRRLIVSGFILPFRPKQSAHAYASIWTPEGSPLLTYSENLVQALTEQICEPIALAMRYGQPSIDQGVQALCAKGVKEIVVLPLYPQHADSTITTSIAAAQAAIPQGVSCSVVPPFYDHPAYRQALASTARAALPEHFDHVLMSYHGLPERHLTKADPTGGHCLQSEDCCSKPSPAHAVCYRHQSFVTAHNLAADLGLTNQQYTISFQSRLGRLPWLQPYTDHVLAELPEQRLPTSGRGLPRICRGQPRNPGRNQHAGPGDLHAGRRRNLHAGALPER